MGFLNALSRVASAINNLGVGNKADPLHDRYDRGVQGGGCVILCDRNNTAKYQAVPEYYEYISPGDFGLTGLTNGFHLTPLACFEVAEFCKLNYPSGNYPDDPSGNSCREGSDPAYYYDLTRWQNEICLSYGAGSYSQYACRNTTPCEGSYRAPPPIVFMNQSNGTNDSTTFQTPLTELDYGSPSVNHGNPAAGFAALVIPAVGAIGLAAWGIYRAYQYFRAKTVEINPSPTFLDVEAATENVYDSIRHPEPIYDSAKEKHSQTDL